MSWPSTEPATGDLITAAQLGQLPIALAAAEGAASSYDFQSIPAVWSHLLIVAALQTDSGNNADELGLRFNNDSGGNYYRQRTQGSGSTTTTAESLAATSMPVGSIGGNTAGGLSTIILWIANYTATGTGARRSVTGLNGKAHGLATGNLAVQMNYGIWNEIVTPINRITLIPAAGDFSGTSSAYLYALGTV